MSVRPYSVVVSTLDFESGIEGSNPSRVFFVFYVVFFDQSSFIYKIECYRLGRCPSGLRGHFGATILGYVITTKPISQPISRFPTHFPFPHSFPV